MARFIGRRRHHRMFHGHEPVTEPSVFARRCLARALKLGADWSKTEALVEAWGPALTALGLLRGENEPVARQVAMRRLALVERTTRDFDQRDLPPGFEDLVAQLGLNEVERLIFLLLWVESNEAWMNFIRERLEGGDDSSWSAAVLAELLDQPRGDLCVRREEHPERLAVEREHLRLGQRHGRGAARGPGQQGVLAEQVSGLEHRQAPLGTPDALDEPDPARLDEVAVLGRLALVVDRAPGREGPAEALEEPLPVAVPELLHQPRE